MAVYALGGPGASVAELKTMIPGKKEVKKQVALHGLFFDALFPKAPPEVKEKVLNNTATAFFAILFPLPDYLQVSLAFLNVDEKVLITDEARAGCLRMPDKFVPVIVLEGHDLRSFYWVSPEGVVMEFEGATPFLRTAEERQRMLTYPEAQRVFAGTGRIDELDCNGVALSEYFSDLGEYGQVYRMAKPGERYLGWMRMDSFISIFEMLATLEEVGLEQFLAQTGERLGRQLKKLHDCKKTFHQANAGGRVADEPSFSHLSASKLEIHGNLVVSPELRDIERFSNPLVSKAADLQGVLGGVKTRGLAESRERALFYTFAVGGRSPEAFTVLATAIFCGYAGITEPGQQGEIKATISQAMSHTGIGNQRTIPMWPYNFTYKILEWMGQGA